MTETEIVVQDIRRELRWSYRDQSTSNLRALASRLIDNKDTADIVRSIKAYTSYLSIAKNCASKQAFNRVQLSARTLCDELKKWELAHAWQ